MRLIHIISALTGRLPGIGIVAVLAVMLFPQTPLSATPVDSISSHSIGIQYNGTAYAVPYFRNYSLGAVRGHITRAVVMVHGTNRNADDYFATASDAVGQVAGASDSTIVIAPQFLTEEDVDAFRPGDAYLFWSDGGWKSGSLSQTTAANPRPDRISSYAVLDTILLRLARNNPALGGIVVAGHSAGGQFVNRYAAAGTAISVLCERYRIPVRCIVANPSSYLYLDARRKEPGTASRFSVPADACPGYNEWKYGLDGLYSYPAEAGTTLIRRYYAEREVVYLLGEEDTDPAAAYLDTSCAAMLQGAHRLERGMTYYAYLRDFYGDGVTARHPLVTVPGVGHSSYGMFTSAEGVHAVMQSDSLGICGSVTEIRAGTEAVRGNMRGTAYGCYDLSGRLKYSTQEIRPSLPGGVYILVGRNGACIKYLIQR